MEIQFENYEGLIRSSAYRWARILNKESDDMIGEGNLCFLQVKDSWDKSRGKFSTFLYRCLDNHYKLIRKFDREKGMLVDKMPVYADYRTPEQASELNSSIRSLSKEAQSVINIVLNGPKELGQISLIQNHLREEGWKWNQIWTVIKEIKSVFN